MHIESEFTVSHPVDHVWKLLGVNTVALGIPGAELTGVVDHQTYEGRIDSWFVVAGLKLGRLPSGGGRQREVGRNIKPTLPRSSTPSGDQALA
jgi:hypothetical protein